MRKRGMPPVVNEFSTIEEREAAAEYYATLTPQQRLEVFFKLNPQFTNANRSGIAKVCRIVTLEPRTPEEIARDEFDAEMIMRVSKKSKDLNEAKSL